MSPAHPHLDGEALQDAIRQAARCRGTRTHRMEPIPGDSSRRPLYGTLITFRCELCGMIRYDTVTRGDGRLINRNYDPPDWYVAANEGKEEPGWWRAKWWESLDESLFIDAEPKVTTLASKRRRKSA